MGIRKKRITVIFLIVLTAILICIAKESFFLNSIRSMYYAGKFHQYNILGQVEGLEMYYSNSHTDPIDDYLYGEYKKEYLKEGYEVALTFGKKGFFIYSEYELSRRYRICLTFSYRPKNNTLYYETLKIIDMSKSEWGDLIVEEDDVYNITNRFNIESKDIQEMQRYIIYEVVISSWRSRCKVFKAPEDFDKLNINIDDATFAFEE